MASKATINKFISTLSKIARAEYLSRDKWVLPSVCIAQAALESGWNLNAKTLFGIKSTDGTGISAATQEYINGAYKSVQATFKLYPTIAAAVDGYYNLITGLNRYKAAVNNPDYKSAITAIKAGGYATDPNYISKIVSIIEKYNLTQYDTREDAKSSTADIDTIAREVIKGNWGNGRARREKLTAAGYDYLTVQKRVNEILSGRG